jgi:uncharacterized protein YukE
VQGLTTIDQEFAFPLSSTAHSEIDVLIDVEEQIAAAEVELANQEKIDLSIFEASNRGAIEDIENAQLTKNGRKMKLTLEVRLQQVQSHFTGIIDDVQTDTSACAQQSADLFGKDNWKDFATIKESVEEMNTNGQQLPATLKAFKSECDALAASCKNSEDAKAYRVGLAKLQEMRTGLSKSIADHKKRVGAIKAAMRKHEKALVQGFQVESESSCTGEGVSLVQVVVNHICAEKGTKIYVVADLVEAWASDPRLAMCVGNEEWAKNIAEMPVYVGLRKWLIEQKVKDADHVACSLEKPSYAETFADKFVALTGIAAEKFFVKVVSATHEAW